MKKLWKTIPVLICVVTVISTAPCYGGTGAGAAEGSAFLNSHGNSSYVIDSNGEIVSVNQMRLYSVAATTGSLLVAGIPGAGLFISLAGLMVTPSIGSHYVGDMDRFWTGVNTRLLITGGGGLAFLGALAYCWDIGCNYQAVVGGATLVSLGVHMFYDIFFLSSRAVREHNEQVRSRDAISVSPWVHPDTGSAGMSVSISF